MEPLVIQSDALLTELTWQILTEEYLANSGRHQSG